MISIPGPPLPSIYESIPDNSNPSSSQKSDSMSLAGPSTSSLVGRKLLRSPKAIKSVFNNEGSMVCRMMISLNFHRLQSRSVANPMFQPLERSSLFRGLFQSEASSDKVHLFAHALKFVLYGCKSESIKRPLIQLKVIDSPSHRSPASNIFVRERRATDVTTKSFALAIITDHISCLLYTSDAADERSSVDLGGRRIIKKKKELSMHD